MAGTQVCPGQQSYTVLHLGRSEGVDLSRPAQKSVVSPSPAANVIRKSQKGMNKLGGTDNKTNAEEEA